MATYAELHGILGNEGFRNKVAVACLVAADNINSEPDVTDNHANRAIWAKAVFRDSQGMAEQVMPAVIAANDSASTAQILAATDSAILTNVNAVIDTFADGS